MDASGNIYAYTREKMLARFADRVSGKNAGIVLVLFAEPLDERARNALEKSFAAIGHDGECLYTQVDGLSADDAFDLVEGVDPLVLVAADEHAASLYAQAVRQDFPLMRAVRVFGREARAFPHLNSLMERESDKQAVWHLLKSLP